jgi:hypothetical protein
VHFFVVYEIFAVILMINLMSAGCTRRIDDGNRKCRRRYGCYRKVNYLYTRTVRHLGAITTIIRG